MHLQNELSQFQPLLFFTWFQTDKDGTNATKDIFPNHGKFSSLPFSNGHANIFSEISILFIYRCDKVSSHLLC